MPERSILGSGTSGRDVTGRNVKRVCPLEPHEYSRGVLQGSGQIALPRYEDLVELFSRLTHKEIRARHF